MDPRFGLKPHCLSFSELLAQNIALISPTMTAALIMPLMYSSAGNLSWLAFGCGVLMLFFVAIHLNSFASRLESNGSIYSYVSLGLGRHAGSIAGWCLCWAYFLIGLAGAMGFSVFASKILESLLGLHLPAALPAAVCILAAMYMAYRDVQLSTFTLLLLEGSSCVLILALCLWVLARHSPLIDAQQFRLGALHPSNFALGIVTATFSLVGFESSTTFYREAREPRKNIPRSILWSLVATGSFFFVVSYVEVAGIRGHGQPLDQLDAPLNTLATIYGIPSLGLPLSAGALISFFALCLSCINAGSRVILYMSADRFFPEMLGRCHKKNATPHAAIVLIGSGMVVSVALTAARNLSALDLFNDAGTLGAFGFLGAYILIVFAAPAYLAKGQLLGSKQVALSVVALLLLFIPMVGSVYPPPAYPAKLFPYAFMAYLMIGLIHAGRIYGLPVVGWHLPPAEVESDVAAAED